MQRHPSIIHKQANVLGARSDASDLSKVPAIAVGAGGYLALQCIVDNGSGGPPTDAPVGTWVLYATASPEIPYTRVADADAALTLIKPNGNAKVDQWAVLNGMPGTHLKVVYAYGSGGGGDSRVTLVAVGDR